MTGISKYCTIQDLEALDSQGHLINLVIDRSGANIRDYDVVRQLEKFINGATADLEGELRRYRQVPFVPTITPLTGLLTFERGNEDVIVTGGDLSEYRMYDEFRPDGWPEDVRMIVKRAISDTDGDYIECWNVHFHEEDLENVPASKYDFHVPKEVKELVAGHCVFTIWERRTKGVSNPHELKETRYRQTVMDIRDGKFRFDRLGEVTHEIPARTNLDAEKIFTNDNLRDYRPGTPEAWDDDD